MAFQNTPRFEAVDGLAVGVPSGWDKGPGAWGCLLSHRSVLESAINDGIHSLLVLEDDAYPVTNIASLSARFLESVPDDWDGLMFGAEFLLPPQVISPGVVRCIAANRSHAYAVRGPFMRILAAFLAKHDQRSLRHRDFFPDASIQALRPRSAFDRTGRRPKRRHRPQRMAAISRRFAEGTDRRCRSAPSHRKARRPGPRPEPARRTHA